MCVQQGGTGEAVNTKSNITNSSHLCSVNFRFLHFKFYAVASRFWCLSARHSRFCKRENNLVRTAKACVQSELQGVISFTCICYPIRHAGEFAFKSKHFLFLNPPRFSDGPVKRPLRPAAAAPTAYGIVPLPDERGGNSRSSSRRRA